MLLQAFAAYREVAVAASLELLAVVAVLLVAVLTAPDDIQFIVEVAAVTVSCIAHLARQAARFAVGLDLAFAIRRILLVDGDMDAAG